MKYFLVAALIISVLGADKIKKNTLACPSIDALKKAPFDLNGSYSDITLYAISNGCVILNRKESVEAIGYDPLNSGEIYQKIFDKKRGLYLYILRSSIDVEQGGKKSSLRF